jgi:lipoprotein signal peptidase
MTAFDQLKTIPTRAIGAVAAAVILADQTTKLVARMVLPSCRQVDAARCNHIAWSGIGLERLSNAGSVFGFGQGQAIWAMVALTGSLLILVYTSNRTGVLLSLAAGLQLGGALSNLADRLAAGSVTDFVVVGPLVVNVADLALLIGTLVATTLLAPTMKGGEPWTRSSDSS